MSKEAKYRGICLACKKARYCTYPRDPKRPVCHCTEAEDWEEPSVKITHDGILKRTSKPSDSTPKLDEDSGKYKGLCKYCKHREICTFPKSEGGVWRCEEFLY